jgi:hypothetical protein
MRAIPPVPSCHWRVRLIEVDCYISAENPSTGRCVILPREGAGRRREDHRDTRSNARAEDRRLRFLSRTTIKLTPAIVLGAFVLPMVANPGVLAQAQPPELIDILPASGPTGASYPLQATIRGTGFMPAGNVVEFGPVTIRDLPSVDGLRITFHVPKLIQSKSEVPPMVLTEGSYRVTVTTASGRSNSLLFRLTRSP